MTERALEDMERRLKAAEEMISRQQSIIEDLIGRNSQPEKEIEAGRSVTTAVATEQDAAVSSASMPQEEREAVTGEEEGQLQEKEVKMEPDDELIQERPSTEEEEERVAPEHSKQLETLFRPAKETDSVKPEEYDEDAVEDPVVDAYYAQKQAERREEERLEKERKKEEKKTKIAQMEEVRRSTAAARKMAREAGQMRSTRSASRPKYSPIEKNEYTKGARTLLAVGKGAGAATPGGNPHDIVKKLRTHKKVTKLLVAPDKEGLVSVMAIEAGSYIAELIGRVCLPRECPGREKAGSLQPFCFPFSILNPNDMLVMDAREAGNETRYVRRSCRANADLCEIMHRGELHIILVANQQIDSSIEVTIPHDSDFLSSTLPIEDCACGFYESCPIKDFNSQFSAQMTSLGKQGRSKRASKSAGRENTKVPPNGKTVATPKPAASDKKKGGQLSAKKTSKRNSEVEKQEMESTEDMAGENKENEISKKKEEEERVAETPKTRSFTRLRIDSATKAKGSSPDIGVNQEEKVEEKEEKETRKRESEPAQKEEKEKAVVPTTHSTTLSVKIGGIWVTDSSPIAKAKADVASPSPIPEKKQKRARKNTAPMNYALPEDRNKPSREEKKMAALMTQFEKQKVKSNRGAEEKKETTPVVAASSTLKRRPETAKEDEERKADQSPPRKKAAAATVEEALPQSSLDSTLSVTSSSAAGGRRALPEKAASPESPAVSEIKSTILKAWVASRSPPPPDVPIRQLSVSERLRKEYGVGVKPNASPFLSNAGRSKHMSRFDGRPPAHVDPPGDAIEPAAMQQATNGMEKKSKKDKERSHGIPSFNAVDFAKSVIEGLEKGDVKRETDAQKKIERIREVARALEEHAQALAASSPH